MKILYVGHQQDPFAKILRSAFRFPHRITIIEPEQFEQTVWREQHDIILLDEEQTHYLIDKIKFSGGSPHNHESKVFVYSNHAAITQHSKQVINSGALKYLTKVYDPRIVREQLKST